MSRFRAWPAAVVLVAVLALAILGPLFTHGGPGGIPYSATGLLGTDKLGDDVLTRVLDGGRVILGVGVSALVVAYVFGVALGMTIALVRGRFETLVLRCADVLMGLPAFITLSLVVVAAGRGMAGVALATVVILLPDIVRVVRNATGQALAHDYIEVAVARGERRWWILTREVLPNLVPVLGADAGVRFVGSVYLVATASFLGYGVQPPAADWGLMILENRDGITLQPWAVLAPALVLLVLLLSANLLIDALSPHPARQPRTRPARRASTRVAVDEIAVARAVDVSVEAPGTPVLRHADIRVAPGEIVALVGESGSGKTTLAQALLGHFRPGLTQAGGQVELGGLVLSGLRGPALRRLRARQVGYVAQDPRTALSPVLRVGALLREALRGDAAGDIRDALTAVRLPAGEEFLRRFPHQLSGGQRQRVALAMAWAHHPRLLVLDEPTSALDPDTTAALLQDVVRLRDEAGVGVVLISHDLDAAAEVADRVVVLDAGRVVEDGPAAQVLTEPSSVAAKRLLAAARADAPKGAPTTPGERVLVARGLVAGHGRSRILHGVSLELSAGGCLAVVGPSGVGKSLLLRCLAGLHRPIAGEVAVDGTVLAPVARDRTTRQLREIQLVPQNPYDSLNPRHTVARIVGRPLELAGSTDPTGEVLALLRQVGLAEEHAARRPRELSGGQRQRVAVARALAARPRVLLCDEITSALDPSAGAAVLDLLAELRSVTGISLLVVTHDPAVVRRLGGRVAVLGDRTLRPTCRAEHTDEPNTAALTSPEQER